jgi:hypothetical protein
MAEIFTYRVRCRVCKKHDEVGWRVYSAIPGALPKDGILRGECQRCNERTLDANAVIGQLRSIRKRALRIRKDLKLAGPPPKSWSKTGQLVEDLRSVINALQEVRREVLTSASSREGDEGDEIP